MQPQPTPAPRAVLFDMTGTLHPQAGTERAAAAAIGEVARHHPEVATERLSAALFDALFQQFTELSAQPFYLVRDLLAASYRSGVASLGLRPDEVAMEAAVAAFNDATVTGVELFPGVVDVLTVLRRAGVATAIVSVNDEAPLQRLVDVLDLRAHVDVILSSEAARSCKPDPAIFRLALDRVGVTAPGDAVFVGDMPDLDIAGAAAVGMRTVLTTEGRGFLDSLSSGHGPRPDHVISAIIELPALLGLGG